MSGLGILRTDTYANWNAANDLLQMGELSYDSTHKRWKVGDGATLWNSLNYFTLPPLADAAGYLYNNGSGVFSYATPGGSGTVTTVSVVTANGFQGTVANASSTPAITLQTSISGMLKGSSNAIVAATAGTDYQTPYTILSTFGALANSAGYLYNNGSGTLSYATPASASWPVSGTPTIISTLGSLANSTGHLYNNGSGTLSWVAEYSLPTATSSTLGGVKPDGTSILNTAGVISATAASVGALASGGTAANSTQLGGQNAAYYQQAFTILSTFGGLTNATGYLYNNGSGTLSWAAGSGASWPVTGTPTIVSTFGALANATGVLYNNGSGTLSWTAAGSGTVTSVSTAAANNGVTATWSMSSPTPALTIGLGAITPTSVAATGAVGGTTLSSSVATGTAPITVTSTTLCTNLHAANSDALGGTAAASYALLASPTFTTPNIGVATGTSFNSITALASVVSPMNGSAAVGTSTTVARQDHVHASDTSRMAAVANLTLTSPGSATTLTLASGSTLTTTGAFSVTLGFSAAATITMPGATGTVCYWTSAPAAANNIAYSAGTTGALSFTAAAANYGVVVTGSSGVPQIIAGAAGVLFGSTSGIPAFTMSPTVTTMGMTTAVFASGGSPGAGTIYRTAAAGLIIQAATGSTYDLEINNAAGTASIISTPVGTADANFGGSITGGISTPSWSSTMTLTTKGANTIRITLGGTPTTLNFSAGYDGQHLTLVLIQDATGSRTVSWGTGFEWGTDVTAPTLTATASKRDLIHMEYDAGLSKWLGTGYARGY